MATTFKFSSDRLSVLANDQVFFTSPIANTCEAEMWTGLDLEPIRSKKFYGAAIGGAELYGWTYNTYVVVAGGNCCDGYLTVLDSKGKIVKITAIGFNVRRIIPVVYMVPSRENVPDEGDHPRLGLLVSGAGCSGKGVRFVDLYEVTPTVKDVVGSREETRYDYKAWLYGADPMSLPDIWDRLKGIGLEVDRERTEELIKSLPRF